MFIVPDEPGSELDLRVLPATRQTEKSEGALLISVGSLGILAPIVVGLATFDAYAESSGKSALPLIGVVTLGAIFIVSGVAVLLSGSREPRVESEARPRATAGEQGRSNVVRDVATARPRDLSAALSAPITPLSYGFSF